MAPSGTVSIDYQSLIHSNCLTFLGNDVGVYITTQVDDLGTWTVHVLKTEHGKRSAVFSESSNNLTDALEALHKKSAMAVNQHVIAHGFALVPKLSSRSAAHGKERRSPITSLDESEIISLDGETSSSSSDDDDDDDDDDNASGSDASVDESLHDQGLRRSAGRVGARPHMAVRRPDPYASGSPYRPNYERSLNSQSRPPHLAYHPPVGLPPGRPMLPPGAFNKPPPPPPPPAPHSLQPFPRSPPVLAHQLHALPPQADTRIVAKPDKTGVLLCITWLDHGELNVVDDCPLSVSYIQIRALQLVRTRTADFRGTASVDFASVVLRAKIRRLHVAGKAYELGSFRDDLVNLFAGFADFPRVEVEVTSKPIPSVSGSDGSDKHQLAE